MQRIIKAHLRLLTRQAAIKAHSIPIARVLRLTTMRIKLQIQTKKNASRLHNIRSYDLLIPHA